jgi:two-component system, LytTR family, sensor kinase
LKKSNLKYHVYGVLIFSTWCLGTDLILSPTFHLPLVILSLVASFWVFYLWYACLYFLFLGPKNKRLLSIPVAVISIAGQFGIQYIYMDVRLHFYHKPYTFEDVRYSVVEDFTYFFIFSLGYFFLMRFFQKRRQLNDSEKQRIEDYRQRLELEQSNALLQKQKLLLERDLLQSENDFLRAQINPHFLYNCLNFFYSETFERQPRVAEAILLLSQIMRYSLTDFSSTGGFARLESEINHIQNVVDIHRMRYGNSLRIELTCEGDVCGKLIAPMILMTLVENVMEHGDLQDPDFPALIRCRVDAESRRVHFSTVNKKARIKGRVHTGIGLKNIRQRLERMHENNYTLTFTDETFTFREELVIPYIDEIEVPATIIKPITHSLC